MKKFIIKSLITLLLSLVVGACIVGGIILFNMLVDWLVASKVRYIIALVILIVLNVKLFYNEFKANVSQETK